MSPRRIWKARRRLGTPGRGTLLGGTVGMSVLVAASSAFGQAEGPRPDPPHAGQADSGETGPADPEAEKSRAVAQAQPAPAAPAPSDQGQPVPPLTAPGARGVPGGQTPAAPGPAEAIALPGVQVGAQRASSYLPSSTGLFRLPEMYMDIPQSTATVTQDLMREQATFTLRDALRNVTGIALQAGEGGGAQGDNLSLRGFNARTDIFRDGVRDVGQYNRDVFNLESIEVLKGPSAIFFGRGSTGGVINQVSKTPQKTSFYEFTVDAGYGPLIRGTADVNYAIADTSMALRLNALGMWGEPVGRDYVEFQRWGVAPSFAFGLGTPTLVTASYYYQQEDNLPAYGFPIITYPGQVGHPPQTGVSESNFYGFPNEDYERTYTHIGTVTLDHQFNEQVAVHSILRYVNSQREATVTPPRIATTLTPTTPFSEIFVNRNRPGRDADESILANQTEALFKFDTWMLKHKLVAGVDLSWQTFNQTALVNTPGGITPLLSPDPFPSINFTQTRGARFETEAFDAGIYLIDDVTILPWLRLLAGARVDVFSSERKDFNAAGDLLTKFTQTEVMPAPRVALVVQPTAAQTYYFAYGQSFNPSAEQLNSINAGNANVSPEQSSSYEVGAKVEFFKGALALTSALFRIDKTDARTTDPQTLEVTLDGSVRSQGFELGIVGRPLPEWNVYLGYTYLDTKILKAFEVNTEGNQVANAPRNPFTLWTTYDFLTRWQVGTGIFYSSSRYGNIQNTSQVPGFVRWDATVAYQATQNIQLRLNVLNIMDTFYFDRAHPAHAVPGDGRTFIVSGYFTF